MKRILFYSVSLTLAACAGRTYEVDRRDSRFQGADASPAPVPRIDPSLGTEGAVVGTAVSAAMIAANPGYYSDSLLRGKLLCGPAKTPALQIACPSTKVVLKTSQGKEVATTQSDNGDFAFKVPKDEEFLLVVDSPKFIEATPSTAKYRRGDSAILRLKRK